MKSGLGYFERALDRDSEFVDAWIGVGAASAMAWSFGGGSVEELERGRDAYATALRLDPGSMRARRGMMVADYGLGGDYQRRILESAAEAADHARPDDIGSLLVMNMAAGFGAWDYPLARDALEQILTLDPHHEEALYWATVAGWALSSDLTEEYAERYFELGGSRTPEILMYVGLAHHREGDLETAIVPLRGGHRPWAHPAYSVRASRSHPLCTCSTAPLSISTTQRARLKSLGERD